MYKYIALLIIGSILAVAVYSSQATEIRLKDAPAQVYFSPRGGAQEAIVRTIVQARQSVFVQAYSFTSKLIAQALIEAKKRGVKVSVIVDKSQMNEARTQADELDQARVEVRVDSEHSIAHNKVMIIDENIVITGSYNFTKSAEEHNAENLLIIKDHGLAKLYLDNWRRHAQHSEGF